MCDSVNYSRMLKTVFEKCVESVKPKSLLSTKKIELVSPNAIRVADELIGVYALKDAIYIMVKICFQTSLFLDIENRKCHLIGFGKAVLGMAVQLERVLGDTLVSGILSVPVGTKERFATDQNMQLHENSVIAVNEGAKNNLPDTNAEITAKRIFEHVKRLTDDDVLFVLISGGGSACLPFPVAPITLNEKIDVIQKLASRGATINELNILRINISSIKGGKLALAARNAHKVISLIISDICGDPLDLIASGPTLIQETKKETAQQILEKYDLINSVPRSVLTCLLNSEPYHSSDLITNSLVHVVGNNSVAIDEGIKEMKKLDIRGICMSKRIEGDVELVSSIYCKVAEAIYELDSGKLSPTMFENLINSLDEALKLEKGFCTQLMNAVMDKTNRSPICLISGGETTVNIKGNGIGGRNQELALRIGSEIKKNATLSDIVFLSAGTDGIDGPCDGKVNTSLTVKCNKIILIVAAGAIASLQMVNDCSTVEDGNIDTYIRNNDSYNLWKQLGDGKHHIVTGHTGTNVMDLHFLMIPLRS